MSNRDGHRSAGSSELSPKCLESFLLRPGIDRILDILRTSHRRQILLLLNEELVETKDDVMMRGEGNSDEIELELETNHLPKLEEAGYIEWNRETGEISKGPNFEEIEPLLKLLEEHADELPPGWP